MKKYSRIFCLAMAVCLILGLLPVTASAALPTLTVGTEYTVTFKPDSYIYDYSFTPSESDEYVFYSDADLDTVCYLYPASDLENHIASDDDDGNGTNFWLKQTLTADTEYVLRVRSYSQPDRELTGKFGLQRPTVATGLTLNVYEEVLDVLDSPGLEVSLTPVWADPQDIELTVDNSGVFVKDSYGDILAMKGGKGKITATTESGLSTSVTLTVREPMTITLGTYEWTDLHNQRGTYKFVAPKTADYIFYPKTLGEADCDVYNEAGEGIEKTGRDARGKSKWFSAEKGKTYIIDMDFDFYDNSTTLTYVFAEKKAATSVSVPATLTLAINEPTDLRFFYTVKPASATVSTPEVTSDNEAVITTNTYGSYYLYAQQAGTANITLDFGELGTKTVAVTVTDIPAMTLNRVYNRATTLVRDSFIYTFTPTADGVYYLADFANTMDIYIDEVDGSSEGMPIGVYFYTLQKDVTYTVYLSNDSSAENCSFGIFTQNGHACIKNGHSYKAVYTIAPTTVNYGMTEKQCSVCGGYAWNYKEIITPKHNSSKVFKDVKKSNWFYKNGALDFVYNSGLFAGTTTTTFEPNAPMTRGMFVTVLGRLAGIKQNKNAKTRFTDVGKEYYAGYVKWASENGIVDGTSKTTFGPEENITREQICKMMVSFAEYICVPLRSDTPAITFKDASKISKWARPYVAKCQKAGIISGEKTDGGYIFRPQGNATRAEVATIIYNFAVSHIDYWTW